MRCPKCDNIMQGVEFDGVEVDRCSDCHGIWFDVGEVELLRESEAAAAVDTGDSLKGKKTNAISRYRCPRCAGGMMRTTDPRRPDVGYEECTSCRGSFFDAGEFSDLTSDSVAAFIRSKTQQK